jgi:WD40 repeat protein
MWPARAFVIGCVVLILNQLVQAQPLDSQPPPAKEKARGLDSHGDPLPEGALARLGTLRFRHDGAAMALVYSPDGKILAGTCAGKVILWEAATGKKIRQLPIGAAGWLSRHALDFYPDGKMLAVAHGEPLSFPTDKFRNEISLWDVASGAYLRSIKSVASLNSSLRFAPDGKTLALNSNSNELHLVEVDSGRQVWRRGIPNSFAREHIFAPDGKTLALISGNPELVQLWDPADGTLVRAFQHPKHNGIGVIALSRDGKSLAAATMDRLVLWDVATGKETASLEAKMGWSMGLAFTPDGKTLVSGASNTVVHVWDVQSKKLRFSLGRPLGTAGASLALSPDGTTAAMGTFYSQIHVWDLASGKELWADLPGHDSPIQSVAFSPDSSLLACGGDRRTVRIWDMKTGKPVSQLASNAQLVMWSPDGKRLACVPFVASNFPLHYNSEPKADPVSVWDVDTGKVQQTLPSGNAGALVWDAAGKRLRAVPLPGALLSSDRRTAIVLDRKSDGIRNHQTFIRAIDLENGKERFSFRDDSIGGPMALSSDGATLATSAGSQGIRLWDLLLGKEIRTLRLPLGKKDAHVRAVTVVAYSPDRRLVASSGGSPRHTGDLADTPEIRVWDVRTGKEVARFESDGGFVSSLAFSPDGKRLLSGMWNGTVLVWDVAPWAGTRKAPDKNLDIKQLARLWEDLASQDAAQAHEAQWALAEAPAEVVPLLKNYLLPEPAVAAEKIRQWLADLDSDKFAVRDRAVRQLRELGPAVEGPLHQALAADPSLEARQRLQAVLQTVPRSPAAVLQSRRAVLVLERIGTSQARQVLQLLAAGLTAAPRTLDAKAALERLAKRTSGSP